MDRILEAVKLTQHTQGTTKANLEYKIKGDYDQYLKNSLFTRRFLSIPTKAL